MTSATIQRDLANVRQALARLRPRQTPGLLTSYTTNGVTRRPLLYGQSTTTKTTNTVARWG